MKKLALLLALLAAVGGADAAWYWPWGGESKEKTARQRVSELMEPVSVILDEASDFAEQGKVEEAVEAYKRAQAELVRIELENPDKAKTPAFATIRTKHAYIDSAIDSLYFRQARQNAKTVAVTDTTELEKKYARLKAGEMAAEGVQTAAGKRQAEELEENGVVEGARKGPDAGKAAKPAEGEVAEESEETKRLKAELENTPNDRKVMLRLAASHMNDRDYGAAMALADRLLDEKPNDSAALNLRAVVLAEQGRFRAAEQTLDQCIRSNPTNHYAFYNMARLVLKTRGENGVAAARRYYEAGRKVGGPVNAALEEQLK